MEATATGLEKALEQLQERTTAVNRERKQFHVCTLKCLLCDPLYQHLLQTKLGAQLTALETRWTELISNVIQIELANAALEAELGKES